MYTLSFNNNRYKHGEKPTKQEQTTGVQRREFLLTEPLLSQVNVDDEEHEATSSLLLPTDKRVHPACGINMKRWNCL